MSPENTIGSNPEAVLQSSQGEWERLRDERNARVQEQLQNIDKASSQIQEMQANLKAHEDEVDRLLALPPGERKLQERMFLEESPKKLQFLQEQLNNAQVEARRIELASRAKVEDLQSDLDLIEERIHDNAMLVKAVGDNREIDHASRLVKDRQNSQRRAKEYQAELNDIPARMYDALVRAAEQMRGSGNTAEATRLQYALIKFPDYPYWQQLDMLKKYAPAEAATIGGEKDRAERLLQKAVEENSFVEKELDQFKNEIGQQPSEVVTTDIRQAVEVPVVAGLGTGGGESESGAGTTDTIPLGDRTPEQVAEMDRQEAAEAASASEVAAEPEIVVPPLPDVPETLEAQAVEEKGSEFPGPTELIVEPEASSEPETVPEDTSMEASTSQAVVTDREPPTLPEASNVEPGVVGVEPATMDALRAMLPGQNAVEEWTNFNIALGSEGKRPNAEDLMKYIQEKGLTPRSGESGRAFLRRAYDAMNAKFRIETPFGKTPEEKRADLKKRQEEIEAKLKLVSNSNDLPEFYVGGRLVDSITMGEIRARLRRPLEAELAKINTELSAGQGGGVETERKGLLAAGIELWRRFRDGQITRGKEKDAGKYRQQVGERLETFFRSNQEVYKLKDIDTPQKQVIVRELVQIYDDIAADLGTGTNRLTEAFRIPFVAEDGSLQFENISAGLTADQLRDKIKELYNRTISGMNTERMIAIFNPQRDAQNILK